MDNDREVSETMGGRLTEIEQFGWLITCGNRAWIYDGPKSGIRDIVEHVKKMPRNAGSTVRYRKIVG